MPPLGAQIRSKRPQVVENLSPRIEDGQTKKGTGSPEDFRLSSLSLALLRVFVLLCCLVVYFYSEVIQSSIDITWAWLADQWWFRSVYFETWLVVVSVYPTGIPFWLLDVLGLFEKYRIDGRGGHFDPDTMAYNIKQGVGYAIPIMIIDTFHVKRFHGVPDEVILMKQADWIQKTRALPEYSPRLYDVIVHIVVALVIYDFLFFLLHFAMHKNVFLYRSFHKIHHTHESVNVKVTHRLHPLERICLVLMSNAGLKIQGAHPFTRLLFVFVFLYLLSDNHSGYDLPWNYDKIIPFNLVAGNRKHCEHHEKGTRYYQPFLTYADNFLEWHRKRKTKK